MVPGAKRKRTCRVTLRRVPSMAAQRLKEMVAQEDQELLKGPPGFEYQYPDDTLYLRWLEHVRDSCAGDKVSDQERLEEYSSRAVQSCCCAPWTNLSGPTPIALLTQFDGRTSPSIAIMEYGKRLVEYLQLSPISIIAARIYLSRLTMAGAGRFKPIVISTSNVHRLLLTALSIGAKFFEDE